MAHGGTDSRDNGRHDHFVASSVLNGGAKGNANTAHSAGHGPGTVRFGLVWSALAGARAGAMAKDNRLAV